MKTKILLGGLAALFLVGMLLSIAALRQAGIQLAGQREEIDRLVTLADGYAKVAGEAKRDLAISRADFRLCKEQKARLEGTLASVTALPEPEPVVRLEDFEKPKAPDPNAELLRLALKLLM